MEQNEVIENKRFGEERALYDAQNLLIKNCLFVGKENGESALKEANHVVVENCYFDLKYPFWHDEDVKILSSTMTPNCRAALWYSKNIEIENSNVFGIKALRECENILIKRSNIYSVEFGWKSNNIKGDTLIITGDYAFFMGKNIDLSNTRYKGKYSFQYIEGLNIKDSIFDTKDAFWHSKNIVVRNSYIKGEYLGWYSENLTLINCVIEGTQPLCYCKNLKLIDCELKNCDLAFEYSEVNASIKGHFKSIKNPTSGKIDAEFVEEIILKESKFPLNCDINIKNKNYKVIK